MKRAETRSRFQLAGALALLLVPRTGALGQIKPGAVAARPAPAMAPPTAPPDLSFKEVQVFFPAFNLGIRLVPPGGASQTSVLRLVEDPAVAPGTKLGPNEANGAPGPIATRACGGPVHATVRVWVTNSGAGPFDATTDALGLTGTVSGQPVKDAFGKVSPGQTQYFETGSLNLAAGAYSAVLALNTAHGGGETNFANNGFESRFQITCGCPAGQVRAAATGKCVAPPGTPCPPGTVRNAAGQCVNAPAATPTPAAGTPAGGPLPTATPAGRNSLVGPTPGPTATAAPAGAPGRGVNTTARLAPPAALAAISPTPTRPPLGSVQGGVNAAFDPCTLPGAPAHVIGTVNNRTSGIAFTPAGDYRITGCGFGSQRGSVTLRVRTAGGQTLEFDLTPKPGAWTPRAIDTVLKPDITGVLDSSSAAVLVKGNDGVEVSQEGHTFRAARQRVMLARAPRSWYSPATTSWGSGKFVTPPAGGAPATQYISAGGDQDDFCQAWPSYGYDDQWKIPPGDLKPGFVVEVPIEAVDLLHTADINNSDAQYTNFGHFNPRAVQDYTLVGLHGLSTYYKPQVFPGNGSSNCVTKYFVRIWVNGPRGVAPM